jgi:CheY-like chemotaxis protein
MAKVLIVDDELAIVESLTEILEWSGYDVVMASNGREGLTALDHGVDIVLVDFMMPVMDGVQMLRALRSDRSHRKLPVILTSAASESVVRASAGLKDRHAPPWSAFLAKPFHPEALIAMIESLLPRNRKR